MGQIPRSIERISSYYYYDKKYHHNAWHFYLSEAATSCCNLDCYDQSGQTSQWDECARLTGLSSNGSNIRQSESTTIRRPELQLQ